MKALKEAALKATPGPWHIRTGKNGELDKFILSKSCKYIARMWITGTHLHKDATYIAAASPDVILKLLEERALMIETLKFYGDRKSYGCIATGWAVTNAIVIEEMPGQKARDILHRIGETL